MNDLQPSAAAFTMTLEITRAATGKTETVDVVCTPINEEKEDQDVNDSPHSAS